MKPLYTIYWSVATKHCDNARQVLQKDGKIAWVCRHGEEI